MSTITRPKVKGDPAYPTSDGKPMSETELHFKIMVELIQALAHRYRRDPNVYVHGDLLMFYERGNKRKHVSPDVFVVFGVPKRPPRLNYILWEEGKGPDVVIEVTSKTTRKNDQGRKFTLYQDVLRVPEYFQFDPTEDYLKPSLQGARLVDGAYQPIARVEDRLPSEKLGLHLERVGQRLRLFDPLLGNYLPSHEEARREAEAKRRESEAKRRESEAKRRESEAKRREAEAKRIIEAELRQAAEAEVERLRAEVERLTKRRNGDRG